MVFAVAGDHGKVQDTPCNVRVVITHVSLSTWSCRAKRTPMAIFIVPSTLSTWKPSAAGRRLSYYADFHAEMSGLRTVSSATGHTVFRCSGSMCSWMSSSCACDPVCMRCLRKTSAKPRSSTAPEPTSLRTNFGLDAVSSTLYSLSTRRRRVHDGAPHKLGASRQVVRRESTTEEVTLMKGDHDAQLLSATAYETPFRSVVAHQVHVLTPLTVRQLQPRAKWAADGVTEAVCALGRAELHTEQGDLLLKKLSRGASAIELMVDILLAGYLASHVSAGSWASCNWLTDGFLPSLGATQRQNHESTVTVPL